MDDLTKQTTISVAKGFAHKKFGLFNLKNLARIDWHQVTARDAHEFRTIRSPKWSFVKRKIKESVFVKLEIPNAEQVDFLCFRSLDRTDYKNLFDAIVSTIETTKLKIEVEEFWRRSRYPDLCILIAFFRCFPVLFKLNSKSLTERIYIFIRVCYYFEVLRKIAKNNFDNLLVFADMQPLDNLLSQYFCDRPTITAQHGLYVDYGDQDTVNTINYLSQPSRYFLAWGENTRALIHKYNPCRRVVVCGKPLLDTSRESQSAPSDAYFTVIFDQNIFETYNKELLSIAYQFGEATGLTINLRLHPWNNAENYAIDESKVRFGLPISHSRFVVGHTTSMIYELLREGIPAFKLRSPEYSLETPEQIQFENVDELVRLYHESSTIDFKKFGRNYISYRGEESLERYGTFFSKQLVDFEST